MFSWIPLQICLPLLTFAWLLSVNWTCQLCLVVVCFCIVLSGSCLTLIQRRYNPDRRRSTSLYRLDSPHPTPAHVTPLAQETTTVFHTSSFLIIILYLTSTTLFSSSSLQTSSSLLFLLYTFFIKISSSYTSALPPPLLSPPLSNTLTSASFPFIVFFSIFLLSFSLSSFIFSFITVSPSPPLPYPPHPPTAFRTSVSSSLSLATLSLIILLPYSTPLQPFLPRSSLPPSLFALLHHSPRVSSTHTHTHTHTHRTTNVQRLQVSSFICCFTEDIVIPDKTSSFTVSANSTTSTADSSF